MATFIVDRVVSGLTTDLVLEVQRLLYQAAKRVSAGPDMVRYVRCTFVAEEQRCICVFEAPSADVVRRVNEIAQVPFRRIQSAIEFSAPGTVTGARDGAAAQGGD